MSSFQIWCWGLELEDKGCCSWELGFYDSLDVCACEDTSMGWLHCMARHASEMSCQLSPDQRINITPTQARKAD
ncbi:hypothetical protein VNO78_11039 [Psophocarpus tetragonolobus]|uniref:Uncharacterized protein n=1 Tax=Psophocarpus tetragonolobus TaxID=3891 RepID=A0AAN9SKS4_PSOTE